MSDSVIAYDNDAKRVCLISPQKRQPTVALCLMSWRSPRTLEATLKTYEAQNLLSYFDDSVVLFQEVSSQDRKIAEKYGLRYITTDENVGIYGGMRLLAESVETDYVLLLENDCILIEEEEEVAYQLKLAIRRLEAGKVDAYRLRHRWEPGEKFDTIEKYKRYHLEPHESFSFTKLMRRLLRPGKYHRLIGTAVYVHDSPQYRYAPYIRFMPEGDFIIDSSVLPWTNQSVLCRRDWLLNAVLDYVRLHPSRRTVNGFQDVEKSLNGLWWRESHFSIGVGRNGLFSHRRLDR